MAEAVVAGLSLAANIIQVSEFTAKVVARLEHYKSTFQELPEAFDHVHRRLRLLRDALRTMQRAIDDGALEEHSRDAVRPALQGCMTQIQELNKIITKAIPPPGASKVQRTWKALESLRYDGKVEKINSVIERYINDLTFHAVSSRYIPPGDRPRLNPSSTVPFKRDQHFIDRVALMTQLETKCQQPAARVALVGLGGVGKSQLAIEYSYRLREQFEDTWVFWIDATSKLSFEKGFQEIARRTQIAAWDPSSPERLKVVSNWLSDESNGRWLMIIDNADDMSVFLPHSPNSSKQKSPDPNLANISSESLIGLLPQSPNGSYLITSRGQDMDFLKLAVYDEDKLGVYEMDKEEAEALLKIKLKDESKQEDLQALVSALDCMPLAVTQAAAYINTNRPRTTIRKYLDNLQKGDEDRAKLLEADVSDARRDENRSNSIIATWHISFERVREIRPSAARLLSLMSLFSPQDIPETLLVGHYGEEMLPPLAWWRRWRLRRKRRLQEGDDGDFDEDWRVLTSFSLITTTIDGSHFIMHGLVQFSTKKWLDLHGELQNWIERYVILMNDNYPWPELDNIEYLHTLSIHAQKAVRCWPLHGNALQSYAYLLHNLAQYAFLMDNKSACETMNKLAFHLFGTILGKEHPDTLRSAYQYGIALRLTKSYEKAECTLRMVYETRKATLGPEHLDTLATMDVLGMTLGDIGKVVEGHAMRRKAIEIREKVLSFEEAKFAMVGLASGLTLTGEFGEAEVIMRLYLNAIRKNQGKTDEFYEALGLLGGLLEMQRKWKEAEQCDREIIEWKESVGSDTTDNMTRLGQSLNQQGKHDEAEKLCRQALRAYEERCGIEDFRTTWSMEHLGKVLLHQNKLSEAEELSRKVVEIRTKIGGEEDQDTLAAFRDLADVLWKQKRFEEALEFYRVAHETFKRKYGNHPDAQEFSDAYNTHRDLMLQSKLAELPAVPENGLQEEGDRMVQKQDETKLTATCEIEHPSPRRTAYRPLKAISA